MTERRVLQRSLPWFLATVLLAPNLFWVARDRSVWSWDPAFYGMGAVDLWYKLATEPRQWLGAMLSVYSAKAPAIGWLGQLAVPLGVGVGSVEAGLLASVLVVYFGTLLLTFHVARRIAPTTVVPAVAGTVFVAASPLATAMSHTFLTETLQLFSVSYAYWLAAVCSSMHPLHVLPHLIMAASIGLLAKVNTPAFCVFPLLLAAYHLVRGLTRPDLRKPSRILGVLPMYLAAATVATMCLMWYERNWRATLAFAEVSARSQTALLWGRRASYLSKLAYWLGAMRETFVPADTSWFILIGIVVAIVVMVISLSRRRSPGDRALAGQVPLAAALQVALALFSFSFVFNEDKRYCLSLGPSLALILVWLLSFPGAKPVSLGVTFLLLAQWAIVQARAIGLVSGEDFSYWGRPPATDESRMHELSRLVDATCNAETTGQFVMTGVNLDWLNLYTLGFYSAKQQLTNGYRCFYLYLDEYATNDVDAAWARLEQFDVVYYISLEEEAMPQPTSPWNRVSIPILRRVSSNPLFIREEFDTGYSIVLFRRLDAAPGSH